MNPTFLPYAIALWLVSAIALLVASRGWARRDIPGALPLALLMLAVAVWAAAAAMENLSLELARVRFWVKVAYIGIVNVPVLWFLIALSYSGEARFLTRRYITALWVIPLLTLIIVATNDWHGWYWSRIYAVEGSAADVRFEHGPYFWFAAAYNYLVMLGGVVVIARAAKRAREPFRIQGLIMLVAALVPWLGNFMYLTGRSPVPQLDLTPFCFLLTGLLVEWNLFRFRLFDLVPVARDAVLDSIGIGVLVLDRANRVVDVNPAARQLLNLDTAPVLGQDANELFPDRPDFAGWLAQSDTNELELLWNEKPARVLEVRSEPLYRSASVRIIVLRDVTARHEMEKALQQANRLLHNQLQEIRALHIVVQEQAIRDSLTGLFNRRYLEETLDRELARAVREGQPLSLLMVDIDAFKTINDTFGHAAGDLVLKSLAELLRRQTRHSDIACRYGGEEFVVVMPGAPLEIAQRRAEQWRQTFAEQEFLRGEVSIRTTISIGITAVPPDGATADALLSLADKALYRAKDAGRNTVVTMALAP